MLINLTNLYTLQKTKTRQSDYYKSIYGELTILMYTQHFEHYNLHKMLHTYHDNVNVNVRLHSYLLDVVEPIHIR